jgi:hypothetical protein
MVFLRYVAVIMQEGHEFPASSAELLATSVALPAPVNTNLSCIALQVIASLKQFVKQCFEH